MPTAGVIREGCLEEVTCELRQWKEASIRPRCRENHSRWEEQQMQRPWGRTKFGILRISSFMWLEQSESGGTGSMLPGHPSLALLVPFSLASPLQFKPCAMLYLFLIVFIFSVFNCKPRKDGNFFFWLACLFPTLPPEPRTVPGTQYALVSNFELVNE